MNKEPIDKFGEPWEVNSGGVWAANGKLIFQDDMEQDENLKRIVQCVNACAGKKDPFAIERELFDRMGKIVRKLETCYFHELE